MYPTMLQSSEIITSCHNFQTYPSPTSHILIGIVIRIQDGRPWNFDSIPNRGKKVLFSEVSTPALRPTPPPMQWETWALSPGVKRPGCDDQKNPTTGEVKKGERELFPSQPSWWKNFIYLTLYTQIFYSYVHTLSPQLEEVSWLWLWLPWL
jgi:hypothetical protein